MLRANWTLELGKSERASWKFWKESYSTRLLLTRSKWNDGIWYVIRTWQVRHVAKGTFYYISLFPFFFYTIKTAGDWSKANTHTHTHTSWTFATRINNTLSARSRVVGLVFLHWKVVFNVWFSYAHKSRSLLSFLRPIDDGCRDVLVGRINLLDGIQRRRRRLLEKSDDKSFPFKKLGREEENSLDANIQRHLVNW